MTSPRSAFGRSALLVEALRRPGPMVAVELRPPRSGLSAAEGMEAWIDLHHSLRRLSRDELFVFLTDNAVGHTEEENLAHVGSNVGDDVDRRRIVPILTCKHTLEYCLLFARRAVSQGYDSLTVLGGDPAVGPPRCVPHAQDLRKIIREELPDLPLGGWANPLKDAEEQVGYLTAPEAHVDFALAQIVSHHRLADVERFLELHASVPGAPQVIFGVFYYRSLNPRTLSVLSEYFPVPAEELTAEFDAGDSAEEICARSIRRLREIGADRVYVSNLGNRGARRTLKRILELV